VAGIIGSRCVSCHSPGGQAPDWPLITYDQVQALRSDVLGQVYSCYMPPSDGIPLDGTERQALLGWLVCGAPNN
jgi:hypothetical protein